MPSLATDIKDARAIADSFNGSIGEPDVWLAAEARAARLERAAQHQERMEVEGRIADALDALAKESRDRERMDAQMRESGF